MKVLGFVLRVANTEDDGAGHFSRCLAIAQYLKSKNKLLILDRNSTFFSKRLKSYNIDFKNFKYCVNKKIKCRVCILDGYNFKKQEKEYWRENSKYLIVIDDILREHNYADLIVNIGLPNKIKSINNVRVVSGLEYSLVEKKILKIAKHYSLRKNVKNILISLGFKDSQNITLKILKFLTKVKKKISEIHIFIVLGSDASALRQIQNFLKNLNIQNDLLVDVENIEYYLNKADIVIGSGGVGLLERVAIGVPSITILSAQNQLNQIQLLKKKETSLFFHKKQITTKEFEKKFLELFYNYNLRNRMYKKCRESLGKNGSKNLLEKIKKLIYE